MNKTSVDKQVNTEEIITEMNEVICRDTAVQCLIE